MKHILSVVSAMMLSCVIGVVAEELKAPDWWDKELLPARREEIRTDGLKAVFCTPAKGTGPWRPVVLLSGSQGGMVRGKQLNRLICCGYCVITPEYLGRGDELVGVPLEFFDQTLEWLNNDPRVVQGGVAVVGGSKGGELALLLASRKQEVEAVVGLVPSSHVWKGIAKRPHARSSWSYAGKDIPYLPYSNWKAAYAAMVSKDFLTLYKPAFEKRANYPESRIPIGKAHAAILLLSGTHDGMWPSTPMCEEMIRALQTAKYSHPFEHVACDGGHGVGNDVKHGIKITSFLREHYDPLKIESNGAEE